ncbi:MAG: hypothetical protein P8048_06735 [Calditrichia bacterium]
MEQESSVSEQLSQKEILEKTFELFYHYALSVVGEKKADSLVKTTYAIKNFMIGLGKVDAQSITINIHDQLEPLNFYEFFEQAKELSS